MKLFRSILLLLLIFIASDSLAESPQEQLNSLLSTFKSMSANFTQTAIVKKKIAKTSSGTMALQRPGKFHWEITTPNHQVIIADGKYLWIYDVDLEQATQRSLAKDPHSPASLLSGSTAALENRFTIIDSKEKGNQNTFQLKPKSGQEMVQQIELQFTDHKLSQMAVIDNLGTRNVFSFNNVKVNPSLANSLFRFNAPKGVDIIRN